MTLSLYVYLLVASVWVAVIGALLGWEASLRDTGIDGAGLIVQPGNRRPRPVRPPPTRPPPKDKPDA